MFDENTSVEMQEVAEPVEETNEDLGAEETEIADQSSEEVSTEETGKTDRDSAFAEMRRAREEAERQAREAQEELATFRAKQEARQNALTRLSGGKKNAELEALADSLGIDVEDVMATLEAEERVANLEEENKRLRQQAQDTETERLLDQALATLDKLDSKLTSEEIEKILGYVGVNNMTVEDGYYAVKAREIMTKPQAPKPIGKLNSNEPIEKEYYTEAEVDAMTPSQQRANYEKIIRSMSKW